MTIRPHRAACALLLLASCDRPSRDAPPSISLEPVVALTDSTDMGRFATPPRAVRRAAADLYVVSPENSTGGTEILPRIFDARGQFLRTIGAVGDGPDEYREPVVWAVLPGDSLLVVDGTHARATLVPLNGGPNRGLMIPVDVRQAVFTTIAGFVVNAPYHSDSLQWTPLIRLAADGRPVRGFGGDAGGCGMACGVTGARILASAPSGGVWVAHKSQRYVLEHFDSAGRSARRFEPTAEWFPPVDPAQLFRTDRFPTSMIHGLTLDSAGRLWIIGSTADPDWEQALGDGRPSEGGGSYRPVVDIVRYRDGIIEVRDTTTGALLASRRFPDRPILLPVDQNRVAEVRMDEDGWFHVEIDAIRIDD